MALTPEEIVNVDLKQSVRGYSVAQVDDLLDRLADQVEAADARILELESRVRDADARVADALETESTLKRTLVTAQQAAERAVSEAREEADRLRADAEREAGEIRAAATEEADELRERVRAEVATEVEQARAQRAAIEERIDALVARERQLRERLRRELEDQLAAIDREHREFQQAAGLDPDVSGAVGEGAAERSDERADADDDEPWWAADEVPDAPDGASEDASSRAGGPGGLTVRVHGADAETPPPPLGSAPSHEER